MPVPYTLSMCGRYRLARKKEILAEVFDVGDDDDWSPRYNIAPSHGVALRRVYAWSRRVTRSVFKKRGQKLSMHRDIRRLADQAQTKTEATKGAVVRIEGAMSSFETAVSLTEAIYTAAVIHCIAEQRDSEWCNLYTSVIYGRQIDLLSVPVHLDFREYKTNLLCLRVRLDRVRGRTSADRS